MHTHQCSLCTEPFDCVGDECDLDDTTAICDDCKADISEEDYEDGDPEDKGWLNDTD
jgi:hypothetical protein